MHSILLERKTAFEASIDHLQRELSVLRTGRATPALVEDITVNAYDSIMEMKGLASIQTQDAKTLVIDPWDKSLLKNIEKAIRDTGVGLNPVIDGTLIRIVMPPMNQENRLAMVKKMKELLEEARVAVRQVREDVRERVARMEKEKRISEDEKFKLFEDIDKMAKEYQIQIEEMGKKKEEEILTV